MKRFDSGIPLAQSDHARLTGQILEIYDFIRDHRWHTLREIARGTGAPEASVSAQLRNLRKQRFGAHAIDREHRGNGLYAYRLVEQPAVLVQETVFGMPELVR